MPDSAVVIKDQYRIALVGNPNSGKTTIFNLLTGLNQKTGNFPGVTVEKKSGYFLLPINESVSRIELIDLPGLYSLSPKSEDERISAQVIKDDHHELKPDLFIYVVDATNLKRSLLLCSQLIELGKPVVLALNMIDLVERDSIHINESLLSLKLGVPVVTLNSKRGIGYENLKLQVSRQVIKQHRLKPALEPIFDEAENLLRYQRIETIIKKTVVGHSENHNSITHKIDNVLLHRFWGFVAFVVILFTIFQCIFFLADYPMQWIEGFFNIASDAIKNSLPAGPLTSLLAEGVVPGLGGILVFIPQISILFFFIAILEETGYMARASFLMDKLMRKFGLNGRSLIPLISSAACAIPAIMGTRTISNWKERIITIMVTPLISCSARLPVYALIISLVIPHENFLGVINLQGATLMLLYLLGFVAALLSAFVFKYILKSTERSVFLMEIPDYKLPKMRNVFLAIFEKVKVFIVDAGKIIIAISIVLWFLSSYGPGDKMQEIDSKYEQLIASNSMNETEANELAASEKLGASYAGIVGKWFEPVIKPLGFNWKIGIALVTSFAAREVFVGTMATIYSVGSEDDTTAIRQRMTTEKRSDGSKAYDLATGLSLLIFYAFAMQCMSTLAVVKRETGGWKWPAYQFIYMSVLAYSASFLVYHIVNWL